MKKAWESTLLKHGGHSYPPRQAVSSRTLVWDKHTGTARLDSILRVSLSQRKPNPLCLRSYYVPSPRLTQGQSRWRGGRAPNPLLSQWPLSEDESQA